ncbi:unnamed protein product [Closterium sp. NIES-54]
MKSTAPGGLDCTATSTAANASSALRPLTSTVVPACACRSFSSLSACCLASAASLASSTFRCHCCLRDASIPTSSPSPLPAPRVPYSSASLFPPCLLSPHALPSSPSLLSSSSRSSSSSSSPASRLAARASLAALAAREGGRPRKAARERAWEVPGRPQRMWKEGRRETGSNATLAFSNRVPAGLHC